MSGGASLSNVWFPVMHGFKSYKMGIYNRWGEEIFYTEEMGAGWNGRYKGEGDVVQQDVYVYKIFVIDLMDNAYTYIGTVTLLK